MLFSQLVLISGTRKMAHRTASPTNCEGMQPFADQTSYTLNYFGVIQWRKRGTDFVGLYLKTNGQKATKYLRGAGDSMMDHTNRAKYRLIDSSPPRAAYMRQWTHQVLVQVMACRLVGAKPLPEPILAYCQLDPWEQTSENRFKIHKFSFMKMHLKTSSAK